MIAPGRDAQETIPLAELTVLVSCAGDERVPQSLPLQRQRDRVHVVVCVHEQLRSHPTAVIENGTQPRHDVGARIEDRGREHCGGTAVRGGDEPLGDRVGGLGAHLDDLEQPVLGEAVQLAAEGVELAVGRHEPGTLPQRQRGEEAQNQLVGVLPERDRAVAIAEQLRVPTPDAVRFLPGTRPFLIDELRRVVPRLDLSLEADVRPGLMRVPGQEQPVGNPEA